MHNLQQNQNAEPLKHGKKELLESNSSETRAMSSISQSLKKNFRFSGSQTLDQEKYGIEGSNFHVA